MEYLQWLSLLVVGQKITQAQSDEAGKELHIY